jgi:hypothetical protein
MTGATRESGTGALLSDFIPKLLPLRFHLFRLYLIMSLQCFCRALLIVQHILEVLSELAPASATTLFRWKTAPSNGIVYHLLFIFVLFPYCLSLYLTWGTY